jgi:hypothetical protein
MDCTQSAMEMARNVTHATARAVAWISKRDAPIHEQ